MGLALTLGGMATAILLALAIPAVRDALTDSLHGNTDQVRHDLREAGASGVLMVFVLGMLHAVVWYPAEILDAAAGYVYRFGPAMPLVMVTWVASGLAAYYIGRHAARPVLYRLAGEHRFERMEAMVERGGVTFLLACRLVPIVPFSLTGLVAGAARVPVFRFTWTTAVGYLPITAYFVYVGSQVESFSAEDPILWIGGIALIIAILFARRVIPRDDPPQEPKPEA